MGLRALVRYWLIWELMYHNPRLTRCVGSKALAMGRRALVRYWLIGELMYHNPRLTREEAEKMAKQAEQNVD